MKYDITIVGAGIVGLATAYQLSEKRPDLKIAIVEKEEGVAQHQTSHNSGVIHSGIYYKPGSSKAINCRKGYQYLLEFCEQYQIDYQLCGKVIVATKPSELTQLEELYERGVANGLVGIRKLSKTETLEKEPYVNALASIWVPEAGIIDYKRVAKKYLEIVKERGGKLYPSQSLFKVVRKGNDLRIYTDKRELQTNVLITCAGLYADKVAKLTKQEIDFQILPFRGEYYLLKEEQEHLVNHLIYPIPNPDFPFLGVHFTPRIGGGVEAGPNAVLAFRREGYSRWHYNAKEFRETFHYPGFKKIARQHWKTGLLEQYRSYSKPAFVRALRQLIPTIKHTDLVRGGAGVRAMACDSKGKLIDDFLILEQDRIINVCNAPSPAATASLAIGETVAEKALAQLKS
ncbi:MAG: L-2-hydroxyglutarate oxidase [Saprospiraceae bacterium]|nr:L-2-hydroxyglutarate oxidase [Saprospiraceae bacterium]